MITKRAAEITESDLQALVADEVREGKTLEYKRDLPGNSDDAKREFLADVSSFANASGGDLLIGVDALDGKPSKLGGITSSTLDSDVQRLDSILRSGLQPRVVYECRTIGLSSGQSVLLLRIPQSWSAPHRVIFKDHSKFYGRNSAGKYPLDVGELRAAFIASETLADRFTRFREDRLAKILAAETPAPLRDGAKAVLHVLPLSAFTTRDTVEVFRAGKSPSITPPDSSGWGPRLNLEGGVIRDYSEAGAGKSYVQVYRNGAVEVVATYPRTEGMTLPGRKYERDLKDVLAEVIAFYNQSRIEPPAIIFLSLLGLRSYKLGFEFPPGSARLPSPLDRNDLILPDVNLSDFGQPSAEVLRPLFDMVWNAYGLERSLNFNEAGMWT